METKKGILNFCNAASFFDYTNIGIIEELNQVRNCINNIIRELLPVSRILVSRSIIDVMISKIIDGCTEDINDKIHDLRDNFLCSCLKKW